MFTIKAIPNWFRSRVNEHNIFLYLLKSTARFGGAFLLVRFGMSHVGGQTYAVVQLKILAQVYKKPMRVIKAPAVVDTYIGI
jgi:hypothetical protein